MNETIVLFEDILNKNDYITSIMTEENRKEIQNIVETTIKYLKNDTIIFLLKINNKWYIN